MDEGVRMDEESVAEAEDVTLADAPPVAALEGVGAEPGDADEGPEAEAAHRPACGGANMSL